MCRSDLWTLDHSSKGSEATSFASYSLTMGWNTDIMKIHENHSNPVSVVKHDLRRAYTSHHRTEPLSQHDGFLREREMTFHFCLNWCYLALWHNNPNYCSNMIFAALSHTLFFWYKHTLSSTPLHTIFFMLSYFCYKQNKLGTIKI